VSLPDSSSCALAENEQLSGWRYGVRSLRLTGVVALKSPSRDPAPLPREQTTVQATKTPWLGCAFTLTQRRRGLSTDPLATATAKSPRARARSTTRTAASAGTAVEMMTEAPRAISTSRRIACRLTGGCCLVGNERANPWSTPKYPDIAFRLAPRLLAPPLPSPRRDLAPIPQPTSSVLGHGNREAGFVGDLVGALLAHAEELGDLDDADGLGTAPGHSASGAVADGR
jgi:hypothetical protein